MIILLVLLTAVGCLTPIRKMVTGLSLTPELSSAKSHFNQALK